MKQILFYLFFLTLLGCDSDGVVNGGEYSSEELIDRITVEGFSNRVLVIDSLLLNNNLTEENVSLLYFHKGKTLISLNKDKEAIEDFKKALVYYKKVNNKQKSAEVLLAIGVCNTFLDNKEIATNQILEALEIAADVKDDKLKANIYNSLARIHFLYDDFVSSIEYALKAVKIQKENQDIDGLSMTYNNLAVIYKNTGNLIKAVEYNLKSLELNKQLQNKGAIAKSYNNLGLNMELLGDFEKAIEKYKQAIVINDSLQRLNSSPLRNLGSLLLNLNRVDEAKTCYLKAIALEKKANKPKIQKEIYNVLLHLSLRSKDFENSLSYQNKRDSLSLIEKENENIENMKLLESQYGFMANKKDLEQAIKDNSKNRIIFTAVFFLLLLFAFSGALFSRNNKLKLEKEKIILEQRVLRSQMNPHFIFNALSAIQNSLFEDSPIKAAGYLSKFSKLIRQNFDFTNRTSVTLKEEIDALINYMDTQNLRFKDKFKYQINLLNDIDDQIVEIPPLLLQPFIENSIEHGFKKSKKQGLITISISKENNFIKYKIVDNGVGFSIENNKKQKMHSTDVFKKRLKLRGNKEQDFFEIESSSEGTIVKFKLKIE